MKNDQVANLDNEQLVEQIKKAKQDSEEERARKYEETTLIALDKWNGLSETGHPPYLINKKVDGFEVRYNNEFLIIPIRDIMGKLWTLQWIEPDGKKQFLKGGKKKGCFHSMGALADGKPIYITEGYATGASVHMATGHSTVIAFDAGNLDPVIEELKKAYPNSPLTIAGDDDRWKDNNTDREKAEQAAQKQSCSVIFPQFKNTETRPTDFNDLHVLEGLEEVKRQIQTGSQRTTLKALNIRAFIHGHSPPGNASAPHYS